MSSTSDQPDIQSTHTADHDSDREYGEVVDVQSSDITTLNSSTIQSPFADDLNHEWTTITADHMIWKRIVQPSNIPNAALCQPLYRISIQIIGKFGDGTIFIDSGADERDLILGHGTLARGMEIGLSTMYIGEHSRFYMNSTYGWSNNNKNRPDLLQRDDVRDMYYDIHVVRQEFEPNIHQMSINDKINYIVERRELGKQLYSEQKYQSSLRQYDRAIHVITQSLDSGDPMNMKSNTQPPSHQQSNDIFQHECILYINQSQCYYKLQRYADCLSALNNALKLQPNNIKALYRRALVYQQRDENELMVIDLRKITQLGTDDHTLLRRVNNMIRTAEFKLKENDNYWRQQYSGMFNRVPNHKQFGLGLYHDQPQPQPQPQSIMQRVAHVFHSILDIFRSLCKRDNKSKLS